LTAVERAARARKRILDYIHWVLRQPWMISSIVPIAYGIGPAGVIAFNPQTRLLCGGLGIGASEGRNFTVGPLTQVSPSHGSSVDDILKGGSVSAGYTTPLGVGYQAVGNGSGIAGGWDLGNPGLSGSATYSSCGTIP
jgi:hypothetical protein